MLTLIVTKSDATEERHCFTGNRVKNLELIEIQKLKYDDATFEVEDDDENG